MVLPGDPLPEDRVSLGEDDDAVIDRVVVFEVPL
jgi:hypothetical protein